MRQLSVVLIAALFGAVFASANAYLLKHPPRTDPLLYSSPSEASIPELEGNSGSIVGAEPLMLQSQTRPLFSPTRRQWIAPAVPEPAPLAAPPPEVPQAVVTAAPELPQATLIGIQKTPGGTKALLAMTGSSEAVWLKEGETLGVWAIGPIKDTSIELANGETRIKLELYPAALTAGPLQ